MDHATWNLSAAHADHVSVFARGDTLIPSFRSSFELALVVGVAAALAFGCASPLRTRRPTSTANLAQEQLARAGGEYRAVVIEPFVIVTKAPEPTVNEAKVLVTAVRQRFLEELFPTAPSPMTIWLFSNSHTFREETARLGELDQSSFYGITQEPRAARAYFNPFRHATFVFPEPTYGLRKVLVHELAHAYVEANHPGADTWIHEGVASVFGYAVQFREGRTEIGPRTWFPILMDLSYRTMRLPSVEEVVGASFAGFHFREDEGGYYEVSTFVVYWLHAHRLLARFLAAYREGHAANVSSARTLSDVSGRSLAELDAELRTFASARASALGKE